jgi:hypothetical protein
LYDARIICVKFWESSKSDMGYQPSVANDCGAQFYSNEEQFLSGFSTAGSKFLSIACRASEE